MRVDKLEDLPPAEYLYDYRQSDEDRVPLWLPHNQGDVFAKVNMKFLTGDDQLGHAMLFMHPCTMRQGTGTLVPRITVIEVHAQSTKKSMDEPHQWTKRYSVVPLPDFSGTGTDAYVGDLFRMGSIPAEGLVRAHRVAVLSDAGRSHMLHRVIYHLTRLAVPTLTLQRATARVQAELQLQADWTQSAATRHEVTTENQVARLEAEFQGQLDLAWPDGSRDVPDTIRRRLTSEDDAEHAEAYKYLASLCESDVPGTFRSY